MIGIKGFQKGNRLGYRRFCPQGHDTTVTGRDKNGSVNGTCKICRRLSIKSSYRKHIDWHRNYRLKTTFGITLSEYNALFASQNGLCAGCYRHQTMFKTRLSVDHDHATGKVRGLLCKDCNWILGSAKDSCNTLERLAAYLRQYGKL
jgi:hypothetical protein